MNVLMICALDVWALSGQGGAPSLFKTLEALGRRGHHVDFVGATIGANHHFGEPPSPMPEIDGVSFHTFDLPSLQASRFGRQALLSKADQKLRFALAFPVLAARKARKVIASRRPDLLYGYEVHGVLAQRILSRGFDLPLVTRFQGTIMRPYLDDRLQLLRRYEEVLALRTCADLCVMTDDGTQGDEVLARLNPGLSGKVRFWRNGLDLDHMRPPTEAEREQARRALGVSDTDLVLVTAARLARWKRIDRAIDALALVRHEVTGARLYIVGDGEERNNLEQQAQERGVGDMVHFAGAVPQAAVRDYLWASDVFLSLNELSNVGNPLLEALASSRCLLTLDEGDTRDLIHDDVNGVLLQTGDPAVIAAALKRLAGDPDLRRRLAAGAAEYAGRNLWTWRQRTDAEIDALESLVAASTPATAHV